MKRTTITNSERTDRMSLGWTRGSRVALLLTVLVVVVMPWTEYFWHFDKFLRGGQDLEFGFLSVTTLICLILLMSLQY